MHQHTAHSQALAVAGVARARSAYVCAMPANGSWRIASTTFATLDQKPGPGGFGASLALWALVRGHGLPPGTPGGFLRVRLRSAGVPQPIVRTIAQEWARGTNRTPRTTRNTARP